MDTSVGRPDDKGDGGGLGRSLEDDLVNEPEGIVEPLL